LDHDYWLRRLPPFHPNHVSALILHGEYDQIVPIAASALPSNPDPGSMKIAPIANGALFR
jgi:hypothetical protein